MAKKLTVISRGGIDDVSWKIFMNAKPAGWEVSVVNPDDEPKLAKEMETAEYLMPYMAGRISPKVVEMSKKLKLIQTASQGTEMVPGKEALGKGIAVANAGGANAISVAEHTILLTLACLRKFLLINQGIKEGKFRGIVDRNSCHELFERTVGVVGFGNVGRRVARLAYGFGANVIYYERMFVPYALRADMKAKPVSLDELLAQSDIVTIHVPAMTANKAMIGWEQLNKMKPTAYLINTSRGANIDEKALLRALTENKIAGAGLDVWDPEPPDPKNPLLFMPNVVATPHAAANTYEMWKPTVETVWSNIVRVSEGQPPINQVREF